MKRMARSNVLVVGMNGLGVETAKNVALAGVKTLTIMDHRAATELDRGSQFYVGAEDVGSNRAEVSARRLAELNMYTNVQCRTDDIAALDLQTLAQYNCVMVAECASLALLVRINAACREHGVQFVCGEVFGATAYLFADFGASFESSDAFGVDPQRFDIEALSAEGGDARTLSIKLRSAHGFGVGSELVFNNVGGVPVLNERRAVVRALVDSTTLRVELLGEGAGADAAAIARFAGYGEVIEVILPTTFHFQSLAEQLRAPTILLSEFTKDNMEVFCLLRALYAYRESHGGALPALWDAEAAVTVATLAAEVGAACTPPVAPQAELWSKLASVSAATFAPYCGVLGSVAAQEIIKSVGGKFTPLTQWMVMDVRELVLPASQRDGAFVASGDRYDSLRALVGEAIVRKVLSTKLFMIGAGAIGCEMFKYYAMLGFGCGEGGSVICTDPDSIEKSNLNRQFLFRPRDINSNKAAAASRAILSMNSGMRVQNYDLKVGPDTESVFTDKFFEGLDVVVNALDNVQARLYVDNRCVMNQRPLMESGTMGVMGNTQPVIPFITESYASYRPPEGKGVAVCTVKLFPERIEHTIQWARARFENEFGDRPVELIKFMKEPTFIEELIRTSGPVIKTLKHIIGFIRTYNCFRTPEDCVRFARCKFNKMFDYNIRALITTFPPDHRTDTGDLFWAPPKRVPTPQVFDRNDALHVQYVEAAANVAAHVFGLGPISRDAVLAVCDAYTPPPFVAKKKTYEVDEKAGGAPRAPQEGPFDKAEFERLLSEATSLVASLETKPSPAPEEFEKDVDSNFHIAFVMTASNLRARAYNISEADFLTTKKIAGNIIPAIATTTSCVSGLISIEMLKYVAGVDKSFYRQAQVNVALPEVFLLEPKEVHTMAFGKHQFSMWDRFDVKEGDISVRDLIAYFKKTYDLDLIAVLQNGKMIYASVFGDMIDEKLAKLVVAPRRAQYVYLDVAFAGVTSTSAKDVPPKMRFYLPAGAGAARAVRRPAAAAAASSSNDQ